MDSATLVLSALAIIIILQIVLIVLIREGQKNGRKTCARSGSAGKQ